MASITIYCTPVQSPSCTPDPSGGDGLVWDLALSLAPPGSKDAPILEGEVLYISESTDITFQFTEPKLLFTDFRYIRSNLEFPESYAHLGVWWNPGGDWKSRGWDIWSSPEFKGMSPPVGGSPTMTVTDRYTSHVQGKEFNYLYLLEYSNNGKKCVCDPKIRQSAGPILPSDKSPQGISA